MMRRSLLLSRGGALRASRPLLNAVDRDDELRREADMRQRVTKGMAMNFPQYDHTVYASYETSPGNFNSGGAGLNGNNNNNSNNSSSSSSSSAASSSSPPNGFAQQMASMPPLPFPFGFLNKITGAGGNANNNNNNNNNNGNQQSQNKKAGATDYLMFFTGLAVMFYSLKLLIKGTGAESDGSLIPMWVATPMLKARYIVYTAVTNPNERDALKAEFGQVQRTMPFLCFFDWLDQKYPNWASGHRYPQSHVFDVVAQAMGPGGDITKIPRLLAGVLQKNSGITVFGFGSVSGGASGAGGVDRRQLIDEMVDTIAGSIGGGGMLGGGLLGGSGLFGGAAAPQQQQAAPMMGGGAFPALNPQFAMPPQHYQQQQYAYPTQQQHQQMNYQQQQYYHQQPNAQELRGTQEVSISDITGGAGVVPQHHYVAPTSAAASSSSSSLSNDVSPNAAAPADPLKRS